MSMKKILIGIGIALAAFGLIMAVLVLFGLDLRSTPSIGSVDTRWTLLGTDYKVAVDAFDDPKVEGVACFISRPRAGGIKGSLGISESPSDASISCRQVGPIRFLEPFDSGESVFSERRSLVFKTLRVVRFYDAERRALVYLSYTTRVIEGSPKNAISAVPLAPWGNTPADISVLDR